MYKAALVFWCLYTDRINSIGSTPPRGTCLLSSLLCFHVLESSTYFHGETVAFQACLTSRQFFRKSYVLNKSSTIQRFLNVRNIFDSFVRAAISCPVHWPANKNYPWPLQHSWYVLPHFIREQTTKYQITDFVCTTKGTSSLYPYSSI